MQTLVECHLHCLPKYLFTGIQNERVNLNLPVFSLNVFTLCIIITSYFDVFIYKYNVKRPYMLGNWLIIQGPYYVNDHSI